MHPSTTASGHGHELELDNALSDFVVLGREDERIGDVTRTSLDRSCLFVRTGRSLLGKPKEHAIHRTAIAEVDPDAMTITVRATREQVESAPEYSDLDERCGSEVERYYGRIAERVDRN